MTTARIGSLTLGARPAVAVVVDRRLSLRTVAGLRRRGADLLEVRIDLFTCGFDAALAYVRRLRSASRLPLIGTIRGTPGNRRLRLEMFRRLLPLVDAVDIEVDTPLRAAVVALARGKTVIVSEHDYHGTPSAAGLRRLSRAAVRGGADIVKMAAMARNSNDLARLLCFCRASKVPMVAVSMGAKGRASRILGPLFGSLYTYACLGTAVAPGQVRLAQLVRDMRSWGLR